jgi:hypothetical protein
MKQTLLEIVNLELVWMTLVKIARLNYERKNKSQCMWQGTEVLYTFEDTIQRLFVL